MAYTKKEWYNASKKGNYINSEIMKAIDKERYMLSQDIKKLENRNHNLIKLKGLVKKLH